MSRFTSRYKGALQSRGLAHFPVDRVLALYPLIARNEVVIKSIGHHRAVVLQCHRRRRKTHLAVEHFVTDNNKAAGSRNTYSNHADGKDNLHRHGPSVFAEKNGSRERRSNGYSPDLAEPPSS